MKIRGVFLELATLNWLQLMLDGLEWDARANDRAIVPKARLFHLALTLLMSAIVLELAGRVL